MDIFHNIIDLTYHIKLEFEDLLQIIQNVLFQFYLTKIINYT